MTQRLKNKIGNYSADHPLAIYRCKQIADNVKFIVDYENKHNIKLDRERGDLKHFSGHLHVTHPSHPGMMLLNIVKGTTNTLSQQCKLL